MEKFRLIRDKTGIYIIQSKPSSFPLNLLWWTHYTDCWSQTLEGALKNLHELIEKRNKKSLRGKIDQIIESE